jgi:hypothetical protein
MPKSLRKPFALAVLWFLESRQAYWLQTCGAMHSHLPPTILAKNGLAGRLELDMIGHEAGPHGLVVYVSGSVVSQQFTIDQAYLRARINTMVPKRPNGAYRTQGKCSTGCAPMVHIALNGNLVLVAVFPRELDQTRR